MTESSELVVLKPKWEGQFDTFEKWVARAHILLPGRKGSVGQDLPAICVDALGRRCHVGKDFMRARDEGAFPVRFFWECEAADLIERHAAPAIDQKWLACLAKELREYGEDGVAQAVAAQLERASGATILAEIGDTSFQGRVDPWLHACFGPKIASDKIERNHRFLEEALELVQACGCTASEAHQLVDYVYGRPVGDPGQEVGGVMVTLAALCLAQGMDMHNAGETELTRIWTKTEQIRAKQAAKPAHSPLPC